MASKRNELPILDLAEYDLDVVRDALLEYCRVHEQDALNALRVAIGYAKERMEVEFESELDAWEAAAIKVDAARRLFGKLRIYESSDD